MTKIFYLPLESVRSRYTDQLCKDWMPNAFRDYISASTRWVFEEHFIVVEGHGAPPDIEVGSVLDANGRTQYCLSQCAKLCEHISTGFFEAGDIIFLQDFWTPGIEGVMYCMEQYNVQCPIFAMCHAQSFDEWDFTHRMNYWMRPYEVGLMAWMNKYGGACFLASSVHAEHIMQGLDDQPAVRYVPYHVVGLPFDPLSALATLGSSAEAQKTKTIIYTSRLDQEKQPGVMLEFARRILCEFPDWQFVITTSADNLRAEPLILQIIRKYSSEIPTFHVRTGLTKKEYYQHLATASVQVNTSLQDYVSWTLLEAATFGCDLLYPDYRSFPECVPSSRRYRMTPLMPLHEKVESMVGVFRRMVTVGLMEHKIIPNICNYGRGMIPQLVLSPRPEAFNVWKESEEWRKTS